jgi:hypothetical protein
VLDSTPRFWYNIPVVERNKTGQGRPLLGEFGRQEKAGMAIIDKTIVLTLPKPSRRNNGVSSALSPPPFLK